MTEIARKILDELMGPDRNVLPSQKGRMSLLLTVPYTDPQVCRHFLIDFCPHMQFLNTKSDIGQCPAKYHEDKHREQFVKQASEREKELYERDFVEYLEKLVSDLEKRVKRGRERLDIKPGDPTIIANPEHDAQEERRTLLDLQCKELLAKIERLAEEGKIQEAQQASIQVDALRTEMERMKQAEIDNPMFRLEKRMELCQTCGAFLIVGDAPKRIEAHYEGRQHIGWARVRQALEDYRKKQQAKQTKAAEEQKKRQEELETRRDRNVAYPAQSNYGGYPFGHYYDNTYNYAGGVANYGYNHPGSYGYTGGYFGGNTPAAYGEGDGHHHYNNSHGYTHYPNNGSSNQYYPDSRGNSRQRNIY